MSKKHEKYVLIYCTQNCTYWDSEFLYVKYLIKELMRGGIFLGTIKGQKKSNRTVIIKNGSVNRRQRYFSASEVFQALCQLSLQQVLFHENQAFWICCKLYHIFYVWKNGYKKASTYVYGRKWKLLYNICMQLLLTVHAHQEFVVVFSLLQTVFFRLSFSFYSRFHTYRFHITGISIFRIKYAHARDYVSFHISHLFIPFFDEPAPSLFLK